MREDTCTAVLPPSNSYIEPHRIEYKMSYTTIRLRGTLIAGLLLLWAGCDSFLEPDPASFSTTVNFYETPDQFERAINGAYSRMRTFVGDVDYRNMTDLRGPTLTRHFDVNLPFTVAGIPQLDEWTMDVANPTVAENWIRLYALVKETNVILDRIEEVEFSDAAQKDRIVGEAKVMRAFAYWVAAQLWGPVPLILNELTRPDEAVPEAGRAPVADVYQQVTADLQDAIGKLPISYSGADVGRITRGAAKFLLGRTYLLTGDYANALAEFEDLDGPEYSYMLLDDYRSIFDPANKNNAESILEIQYDPSIAGQPDVGGLFAQILPWNDENALSPSNVVTSGLYMPTPDVINTFEEGDERFEASIAWFEKAGNSQYPEIAFGDELPYLYKFYWPEYVDSDGQMNMNWVVFRFADVLLSAAEAEWRLGNETGATGYLDRVRDRAGLPPVNLGNYTGEWTGSPLGDAILLERSVELLGEGHYWLDLKRFGDDVALRVMRAHGEAFRARDPKTADVYNIEEYKLLYPIPPREVVLGELEQNPGWG